MFLQVIIPSSVLILRFNASLVASPLFIVMATVMKLRIWTETRLIKHIFIVLPNILKGTTFLHEGITSCYVSCLFHKINVFSKPSRKPASYIKRSFVTNAHQTAANLRTLTSSVHMTTVWKSITWLSWLNKKTKTSFLCFPSALVSNRVHD